MSEVGYMLQRAATEIRELRRRNEVMGAQMMVVEAFHAALLGAPRGGGMSPDVVWEIDRYIQRLADSEAAHEDDTEGQKTKTETGESV